MDYSPEKLSAFAVRRFQSVTNDETVGQTYEAIFGPDPDAEALGKKLSKRAKVKAEMEEMMGRVKNFAVANVGSITVLENNVKEFLSQVMIASPNEASLDNPLCDVKVLKDGSKVAVFPDKTGIANLAARVTKLVGAESTVQFNFPSWEPGARLTNAEQSWELPESSSLLPETMQTSGQ
jgi:hypothetical protein